MTDVNWREALVEKYPELFTDTYGRHLGVSDGWRAILEALFETFIFSYREAVRARTRAEQYLGRDHFWNDAYLANTLIEEAKTKAALPVIVQVKEKMGGLRVYLDRHCPCCEMAIKVAENLSFRTCEVCGKTGPEVVLSGPGWFKVTCPEHRKKDNEE